MFITKSFRKAPPITLGASPRRSLRQRVASALGMLIHGVGESQPVQRPLDPRIVLGIDRHAEIITEAYDDRMAGSFARDILTESAHVIIDAFGVPGDDEQHEPDETNATADLLAQRQSESR